MKGPGTPAAPKPRHALAAVLLAGAVVAAYANSFDAGFVQDGKYIILGDQRVQAVNVKNLGLIFSQTAQVSLTPTSLYRPLNTLSYLFNYAVLGNGSNPFGYHVVNLAFHIANAFLVYLLALVLLWEFLPAVFTAAIWALHPVCTEGVTNLVGRADEMAAMAVLGSLLLYIHGTTAGVQNKWLWLTASSVVFAAGFLSKENAVVMPGLVILYDVTYRFPPARRVGAWIASAIDFIRQGWWVYVPPLALVWYMRHVVLASSPPALLGFIENPTIGAGFLSAEMTAIKVLGKYLWMLVWPADLSCDYAYNQIPLVTGAADWQALAALAAIAGLGVLAAICFRRKPAVFFLIASSAVMILPMSNLLIPIGSIMAVRFLYLPSIGFAGCVVIAVYAVSRRWHWKPKTAAVVLCGIAALFGIRTLSRNPDYKDDKALYTSALEVTPNSAKVRSTISFLLAQKQPLSQYIDQVVAEADAALAIVKDVPDRMNQAPLLVEIAQRYGSKAEVADPGSAEGLRMPSPEARMWYRKAEEVLLRAVAVDRAVSAAYREADLERGKTPDQIPTYGYEGTYWYLGRVQLRLGDGKGAVESYLYERRFNPLKLEIYSNLGRSYLVAGRVADAAITFLEMQFLQESAQDTPDAIAAYRMLDPMGCATTVRGGRPAINFECPLVRQHACAAFADLTLTFREAHLMGLAESAVTQSRQRFGCR